MWGHVLRGVLGYRILADGRCLESSWEEVLTNRGDLVASLRLYVNPIAPAPAVGVLCGEVGPPVVRLARRDFGPFEPIYHAE